MAGLFQRFCDHEGDRLSLMVHVIVLQDMQSLSEVRIHDAFMLSIRKPRRIAAFQVLANVDEAGVREFG